MSLYIPGSQSRHAVDRLSGLGSVPAPQFFGVRQSLAFVAGVPPPVVVPSGQTLHQDPSVVSLYFPRGQSLHFSERLPAWGSFPSAHAAGTAQSEGCPTRRHLKQFTHVYAVGPETGAVLPRAAVDARLLPVLGTSLLGSSDMPAEFPS